MCFEPTEAPPISEVAEGHGQCLKRLSAYVPSKADNTINLAMDEEAIYAMAAAVQAVGNDPASVQAAKGLPDWPKWDASI